MQSSHPEVLLRDIGLSPPLFHTTKNVPVTRKKPSRSTRRTVTSVRAAEKTSQSTKREISIVRRFSEVELSTRTVRLSGIRVVIRMQNRAQ